MSATFPATKSNAQNPRRISTRVVVAVLAALFLTIVGAVLCLCPADPKTEPWSLSGMLGPQLRDRDIILKISPTCPRCVEATKRVLDRYPAKRVLAITCLTDGWANAQFSARYGIPLIPVSVQEFYALDGTLEAPRCYRVKANTLVFLNL